MPTESAVDRYAVFGNPVGHSQSPRIHGLFAEQTGQRLRYEARLAPLDGFAAAVREFVAEGGKRARGANVTVPFKEDAFRLASRLTPRAEAARAVNTLSFADGDILGDNTDGAGLVQDITVNLGIPLTGRRILLLGAGGAARGAILPLLQQNPAALIIANRTADRAIQLAAEFSPPTANILQAANFEALERHGFDVIVNATSAGLSDAALPIPATVFANGALAYEMLYGRKTPFMAQARTAGATVADGLGMLVEQAAEAFTRWRGVRPDTAPVLKLLRG